MKDSNYWSNDLLSLSDNDYRVVLKKLTDSYSKVAGVVAIYSYGDIKEPGISDLDMLILIDSSIFKPDENLREWCKYSDICVHGPHIFPAEVANEINCIRNITNVQLVWGEDLLNNTQLKTTEDHLADLVDFTYFLSCFYSRLLYKNDKSVRRRLFFWKSFQHTLTITSQVMSKINLGIEEELKTVRGFFQRKNHEQIALETLVWLESKIPHVFNKLYDHIDDFAINNGLVTVDSQYEWEGIAYPSHFQINGISNNYEGGMFNVSIIKYLPRQLGFKINVRLSKFMLAVFREYGNTDNNVGMCHREIFGESTYHKVNVASEKLSSRLQNRIILSEKCLVEKNSYPVPLGIQYTTVNQLRKKILLTKLLRLVSLQ